MSASRFESINKAPHLPQVESSSSDDLKGQEIELDLSIHHNLLLQDMNYTKDTVAASETLPRRDNEKASLRDGEKKGSVGFWHQELNNVRLHVIKLWARTVLILTTFILLVLCLFNGVFFHIPKNFPSLIVYVVDFDRQVLPYQGGDAIVGPAIVQATESMAKSDAPHLGFITIPPSMFDNDPIAVRKAVYDFKAYAAIIINANATVLLQQAVEQGNTTYDPKGAAQIIYVSARDQNTVPTYVVPVLTALEMEVTSQFSASWTKSLMQNDTIPRTNFVAAPQALSPAIGFTTFDLRPFGPANVTPAVSIGLIYLIIIAFFSFTFFLPIHLKFLSPRGHPPLHFYHLIIWRWLATTGAYFFLSLGYSFIALAFQVPFSNGPASPVEPAINPTAYGKGTFVVYWMINFLGMSALGLACENVAMALGNPVSTPRRLLSSRKHALEIVIVADAFTCLFVGRFLSMFNWLGHIVFYHITLTLNKQQWTAMWLVFWVVSNVATGFYNLDLSPAFYRWGYAWPLHNIVEASHQVLFDLHSRIGLNIGVLVIWVVINSILFAPACYLMSWEQQKAGKKAAKKEKDWLSAMSKQRSRLGIQKSDG